MNIRISAERVIPDPRSPVAISQPHRRHAPDPLDPRLECPLGRLRASGRLSEAEYQAGCRWRTIYHKWLCSIGAPNPFAAAVDINGSYGSQDPLEGLDDEQAEQVARMFRLGTGILKNLGQRVFHAVNAIAVYEEPEELGDSEYTVKAAKIGLNALAAYF